MQILYKSKNFIVINKPVGIPSQSDLSSDDDAMSMTSQLLAAAKEPDGLFPVHRLDRVVGGLLVFARNKRAAAEISKILTTDSFKKTYYAVAEGDADGGTLTDYIFKDSVKGKAFIKERPTKGAKYAELSYLPLAKNERHTLISVNLKTGRFHQIRVQLSSRGMPLAGDGKYGSHDNKAHTPALFACALEFSCLGEHVDINILPDIEKYPWCEFPQENYKS